MKTFIRTLLSIVLLLSLATANAENFTIHNGVSFSMPKEEVILLEEKEGFILTEEKSEHYSSKTIRWTSNCGKIAGVEDSKVSYYFDYEDNLFAASYDLGSGNYQGELEPAFSTVENALKSKYGDPEKELPPFAISIGFAPSDYLEYNYSALYNYSSFGNSYSTWTIQQEDGSCVVIAHIKDVLLSGKYHMYYNVVGYQWYSAEEIANELANMTRDAEENEAQLSNDL